MKRIDGSIVRRTAAGGVALGAVLGVALALALAGCGGGEQVAGVGSGGSGGGPTAIGTATGFGSVIVDGDRYDDSATIYEVENDPRAQPGVIAGARLGQRLQITYTEAAGGQRVAERVRIEPALIGSVQSLTIGMPITTIRIGGQDVRINLDPNRGPVTFFERFSDLAALLPAAVSGSRTEVHGALVWDAGLGRHVLEASRIERLDTLPAGLVRMTGVVAARDADGFKLGDLAVRVTRDTLLLPAGRTLANGQVVTVWGRDLATAPALTLTADSVRVRDLAVGNASTTVAGTVSRLDSSAASFDVAGVRVAARSAAVVPASVTLANGQYAIVRGRVDAAGVLQAEQVRIRRKLPSEPEVVLQGAIASYQSDASFAVRGVTVDASGVTLRPACPSPLRDGVVVRIEGSIVNNNVVVAESLRCTP